MQAPPAPTPVQIRELGLLLTRVCNAACAHCGSRAGPDQRGHLPREHVATAVADAAQLGLRTVMISGGEPFALPTELLAAAELAQAAGLTVQVCSNGSFGADPDRARSLLADLQARGLEQLLLSTDRFHLAFVPLSAVISAARTASELGIPCQIAVPATARDWHATTLVATLQRETDARVLTHPVHPIGRGEALAPHHFRWPALRVAPCDLVGHVEVAPDGTVSVCPASAELPASSPMILGNLAEDGLATLLHRFQRTPLYAVLQRWGPLGLHALATGGTDLDEPGQGSRRHDCHLCRQLTTDDTVLTRVLDRTGIALGDPVDDATLATIITQLAAILDGLPDERSTPC